MNNPKVAIIGPGTMGRAFAHLLSKKGYEIVVAGVQTDSLNKQREGMEPFPLVTDDIVHLAKISEIIFITTPDDYIGEVASFLEREADLKGKTLIHTSGVHSSAELGSGEGYNVLSLHPMQALADWRLAVLALPRSYFFYEGNRGGVEIGREIISRLGAQGVAIIPEKKPLYHMAAVIFSNFLVSLLHFGSNIQKEAGIVQEEGLHAAWPLIEGTIDNIKKLGPVDSLTGPIARGDIETVKKHLAALEEVPKNFADTYRALALYNLEVAKQKGLSEESYFSLQKLLEEEI